MSDLIEIMRREAQHVVGLRQFKGTLVVTGYNPKTHAVKGILVPQEVETGWIPISSAHTGNGFGVVVGPNVGDPKKLDGDVFDVEFENGDPNTPVAKMKHFSEQDAPPEVQSGEILFKQGKGSSTHFKADGSVVHTHGPSGATITWDKDGNYTHDNKGKDITVATTGAYTQQTPNGNLA